MVGGWSDHLSGGGYTLPHYTSRLINPLGHKHALVERVNEHRSIYVVRISGLLTPAPVGMATHNRTC